MTIDTAFPSAINSKNFHDFSLKFDTLFSIVLGTTYSKNNTLKYYVKVELYISAINYWFSWIFQLKYDTIFSSNKDRILLFQYKKTLKYISRPHIFQQIVSAQFKLYYLRKIIIFSSTITIQFFPNLEPTSQ